MIEHIKKILKHTLNYGVATALTSLISFFLIPVYTRYLTPSDYGIFDLVNTFITLLDIVLILGLTTSFTVIFYNLTNKEELKESYSTIINFFLIYSTIMTILIIIINLTFGLGFMQGVPRTFINYAAITCYLNIFIQLPMNLLQLQEKSKKYGILNIIQFLIKIFLIIFFVVGLKQSVAGMIKANLISAAIIFLIAIYLSRGLYAFKFNITKLKSMLKIGLPIIPHGLATWGLIFADRIIQNSYVSMNELGIYSFAYKIGTIMNILVNAINQAWFPFFMDIASNKGEEAKKIFTDFNKYYFLVVGFICFGASSFSREIVYIMGTEQYYPARYIIPFILISYLMQGMYFMNNGALFYTKKTYYLPISTGVSSVVNIAFNLLLVPRYGILGSAIANLISYFSLFLCVHIINLKIYGVKLPYARMFLIAIIYAAAYLLVLRYVDFTNVLGITIKILISIVTLILVVFICVGKEERKKLVDVIKLKLSVVNK